VQMRSDPPTDSDRRGLGRLAGRGPDVAAVQGLRDLEQDYAPDEDRPLGSFLVLSGSYVTVTGLAGWALRHRLPDGLRIGDLALFGVATHKLSRLIAEDPVTSPLRAPFTRFEGSSAPAEVDEEVRGTGLRHAVGELLTCPFCLAQWIATTFFLGLVLAPRVARTVASLMVVVTASDVLQLAYAKAQQWAE
jgi:hypothetical protein